jgi:hypothetical protein
MLSRKRAAATRDSGASENVTVDLNNIYNMDCLEGMKSIADGTVDMILCDLPYGTTQNEWDSVSLCPLHCSST